MTNGYVCGAIHTVVAHPTNANIVYIGAVNGGVWKTTNATASDPVWTTTTDDMPSLSVGALAFDSNDVTGNTVWAGVGRFSSYSRIGGSRSGLLKTTDGGASWTNITGGGVLVGKNISGLVVRGNTILVSVNTADSFTFSNIGIWRSVDGGANFTRMSVGDGSGATGLPEGVSYDIVSSNSSPNTVYTCIALPSATGVQGIYKSTDLGATWTRVSPSQLNNFITASSSNIEMSAGNANNLYVGILESGAPVAVFNTIDGGANWSRMDLPTMPVTSATVFTVTGATNASPIVITTSAAHGLSTNNYVEVSGVTGNTAANGLHQITFLTTTTFSLDFSTGNGVYSGGGTARYVTSMNPRGSKGPESGAPEEIAGGQGSIHFSIIADPTNANLVYVGGDRQDTPFPNFIGAVNYSGNLWRGDRSTAPNGLSPSSQWKHLTHSNSVAAIPGGGTTNNSSPHADSREMAFDAIGQLIEVDDGGIFRRTNPQSNAGVWTSMAGNLQVTEAHSVTYDTVSDIIITGNQDNGTSVQNTPGSMAYTAVSTGDGGDVAAAPNPSNPNQSVRYSSFQNLGSGTFRRRVMSSANTFVSQNFPALAPQGGAPAISGQFTTPVEINRVDANRLLIGASNGVYESTDQGATVSRISTQTAGSGSGGRTMVYGGRQNGVDNEEVVYFASGSSIYRRVALAASPVAVAGYSGSTVRGIIVDSEDYDHLFAIDNNQVFRSTNGGASFTDITGDIPAAAKDFRCLEFIRSGTNWAVLAGTLRGVYAARSDAVADWGQVGNGMPNVYIWDMDYDVPDNLLVVSTLGRGVWKFGNARGIAASQDQTITFNPIDDQFVTSVVTLSATGGLSGNPVTFAVTSGPATITGGNQLSFSGTGSVTITASQAGDAFYLPAPDVSITFNVIKAPATITLGSLAQTYTGTPRVVTYTTSPPSLPVNVTYNGSPTAPTNVGSYPVLATINSATYQGSASGTLVVSKATAGITLSDLNQTYNGGPRPVTVVTNPVGLSYTLTYNGVASAPFNAGTYAISVTINNANYDGTATGTLVVAQAAQTINFPLVPDTTTISTVTLAATGGGSGNPVTYTVAEGPAQISGGNQVTFSGAGSVRIIASQAGNTNYLAATSVERTFNVAKAIATTGLSNLSRVYDGNPKVAGVVTTPAGLGVSITYNGSTTAPTSVGSYAVVATVNDALYQGSASGTLEIAKAPVTITLSGLNPTYTGVPLTPGVTAVPSAPVVITYDGSSTPPTGVGSYALVVTVNDPSYEGSATGTFVIGKAAQVINFPVISAQFATDTVLLSATGGGSIHPVQYTVAEGPGSISGGNLLTFTGAGDVSIEATQAGDENHHPATPVTRSFTVTRFPATVTLTNLNQNYNGSPRPVTVATSPGGLAYTLTYEGQAQAPVEPGNYFVLAIVDEEFYEGDSGGFLVVAKGVQTIDFPPIPDQLANGSVTLSATGGPSGNPVTFEIAGGPGQINGTQLTFTGSGAVTVRARQLGNTRYSDATPVLRTVTVNKAPASLTLGDLAQTYDGLPKTPSSTTDPVGLAVSYTFDGSSTTPTGAGSYAVVGTINDARYTGTASDSLVVGKAAQVIDFPALPDQLTTASVNLVATGGGSGNPVTFAVTAGPGSINGGNILTFTGAGQVEITASQAGGANHFPAANVPRSFLVSKATAGVTLTALRQIRDGSPREVIVTSDPPGLGHAVSYDGDPDAPLAEGTYEVFVTLDDPIYEGAATDTLIVDDPADLIVVSGGELPALSSLGALDLPTFEVSRYEVTWGFWREVREWAAANGYDIGLVGEGCDDDHPVHDLNWYDAVKWCNARTEWENATLGSGIVPAYRVGGLVYRSGEPSGLTDIVCDFATSGYRLPTATEWEFAARGGVGAPIRTYPGGDQIEPLAWYAGNSQGAACNLSSGRGTWPGARKTPNHLGIHEMAGNLSEWTWTVDPGNSTARLTLGGSWDSAAVACALGAMGAENASLRLNRVGLRVGRSVSEALAVALDAPMLPWNSGNDPVWRAQTTTQFDGVDAAASGALGEGGETWVETSVSGPGNVEFNWKINLPSTSGNLQFSIGANEARQIQGNGGWLHERVYVPAGDHVLRWTYRRTVPKGTTPDPTGIGAWLDGVVYTLATEPQVTTSAASSIVEDAAESGGEVIDDGGAPLTARGVVLGSSPNPALGNGTNFSAPLSVPSAFTVALGGLAPGTTYHARAYATNDAGTGYGEGLYFTTDETLPLVGGLATESREILAGDRHVIHFSLSGPRFVDLGTLGGAALRAELHDGTGALIASFEGDSDVTLTELLYAGQYSLHLYRMPQSGGAAQSFDLSIDASDVAETRPDVEVGASPLALSGTGIYRPSLQLAGVVSTRAAAVAGYAAFSNRGNLPDTLALSGSGGSTLFAVSYFGPEGNITAGLLTGAYRTAEMVAPDAALPVRAVVTPNKRKLTKKKGKRSVILKKVHPLLLRAVSVFDGSIGDEATVIIQTR